MLLNWEEFCDKYPSEAFPQRDKLLLWKRDHTKNKEPYNGLLCEKNYWIWGPTGTGKSKWARSQCEYGKLYFKLQNKWLDSYDEGNVKIVIIEDLNPEKAKMQSDHIKIWADRYWFQGEVKGASIMINPKDWNLIVTSNYSIDECFPNEQDALASRGSKRSISLLFLFMSHFVSSSNRYI